MSEKRRFSEEEASAIMRRAAQLQTAATSNGSAGPVTEDDLRAIASEAGIDPSLLRQAIVETEGGQRTPDSKREVVRVVEGELEPDEFDIIQECLGPQSLGMMSSQVGRTMQRSVRAGAFQASIAVTSRGGSTKISVIRNFVTPFMMSAYPFLLMSFISSVNLLAHRQWLWGALALTILPALGFLAWLWAKQVYEQKTIELADRVAETVSSHLRGKELSTLRSTLAQTPASEASDIQAHQGLSQE